MIDIKLLRQDPEAFRAALATRSGSYDVDALLAVDEKRRACVYEFEQLRAEQNKTSELIAQKKRAKEDASAELEAMKAVSARLKELDEQAKVADGELESLLLSYPNLPDASVPVGKDETANRCERVWGEKPSFAFEPKGAGLSELRARLLKGDTPLSETWLYRWTP